MKKIKLSLISGFLAAIVVVGSVFAAQEAPNPAIMGGDQFFMEVSQAGTLNALDAPIAYAKFYFEGADGRVTFPIEVFDGCYNAASGYDGSGMGQNCNLSSTYDTDFRFYATDTNENIKQQSPVNYVKVSGQTLERGAWETVTIDFSSIGITPQKSGNKDMYVIVMQAEFTTSGPSGGRVNAFKLKTSESGSHVGYYGGDDNEPFSIQNRVGSNSVEDTFTFEFATPCEVVGNVEKTMRWNDADYQGSPQD
ncbi:MAG: hypothetical protein WDZ81_01385, partial [Candidatus Saccharimonadales bacterium]